MIFLLDWCGKKFLMRQYLRLHFKRHLETGESFKPKNHMKFVHPRYDKHPPVLPLLELEKKNLLVDEKTSEASDKEEVTQVLEFLTAEEEKILEELDSVAADDLIKEMTSISAKTSLDQTTERLEDEEDEPIETLGDETIETTEDESEVMVEEEQLEVLEDELVEIINDEPEEIVEAEEETLEDVIPAYKIKHETGLECKERNVVIEEKFAAPEIKQEPLQEEQLSVEYELCAMENISNGIKLETEDDDREFLRSFLPHMERMSSADKRAFKANARMIVKRILGSCK